MRFTAPRYTFPFLWSTARWLKVHSGFSTRKVLYSSCTLDAAEGCCGIVATRGTNRTMMQQEKVKKFHLLVWKAIVLVPYGKNVSVHNSLPVLCISIQASREVGDILYLHREKEQKSVSIKDIVQIYSTIYIHCIRF